MLRSLAILLIGVLGVGACAPNLSSAPGRPGVGQQRGASGNVQTVQLVVIPNDARCQLSGTAYRHGMQGSGLLSVPIKASPVTIYCAHDDHKSAQRELASTLEEPGGLATEAITGGLFGFFKSVMIGQGQRYPPMVHVILPPITYGAEKDRKAAYNRQLIESNWKLLKTGRDIECKNRKGGVETSICLIHCDTARFTDYKAADLKAYEALTQR